MANFQVRPIRFHLFGKKVVITFPFLTSGENPWGEDYSEGKEAAGCPSLPNCLVAFWNDKVARMLEPYISLSEARMSAMSVGARCIVLESDAATDVMDMEKERARGLEDMPQPQQSMRVRPEDVHLISGCRDSHLS